LDLVVIYNDQAGDGAWSPARAAGLLDQAGHRARIVTRAEDWPAALASSPDGFVAAGGDGTVHEVIRAMASRGSTIPVAVLPIGTANNVAHSLGYDVEDDLVARAAAWQHAVRPLQVARVDGHDDEHLLVETFGIGAFAEHLGRHASNGDKPASPLSLLAMRENLVRQLLDARPMEITVDIDGERVTRELLLVECVNLGYLGPRLRLAPEHTPGDGSLTVCGIAPEDREAAASWISTGEGDVARYQLGRGCAITITAPDTLGHVDGRRWPSPGSAAGTLRVTSGVHTVNVTV
jgi:diacylglycerol kinase (ATP)